MFQDYAYLIIDLSRDTPALLDCVEFEYKLRSLFLLSDIALITLTVKMHLCCLWSV